MKSVETWVTEWRHDPELDHWRYDERPLAYLIAKIQKDALAAAAELVKDKLYRAGRKPEAEFAHDAILERSREI